MSSSSEDNHEVETARKRLHAATTQVVATTTNLQMQQKHMEMQKLLLVNAQGMVNAANKEYNDALDMLASVEKRCSITSSDEQQQMKKAGVLEVNDTIEHKIYTNRAPPNQSVIDQGKQQSKHSESSNKRRKVSLTSTTAAAASSLGPQSSMSNNSRGKDLSQMQKAISNRSPSIAAATTTTAAAAANNVSTGTTSSTLPMNINQLLYGCGMPPYLVNNGMLPQTNSIGNRTEPSLDQLSRNRHGLNNMIARPPPPVVHTNTTGTTAHRVSINDNNKNESVKHSWLGLAEETKETIRLEAEKAQNISA